MARKKSITSNLIARGMSASLAGLRASSALAIDSAINKALGKDPQDSYSEFASSEAERFVQELGRLKGTYVKIGQMMALFGEHFLPGVLTQALHKLEDNTHPLSWSELEPTLEEALGKKLDNLDVDPDAIAAASLAQVHKAIDRETGEALCLKIQYPGLSKVIDREFNSIIKMMLVARWLKRGRELDAWISSMREQIHNEIDYSREMALTLKMERHLAKAQRLNTLPNPVRVPEVRPEYSADGVIAMEFIDGISPAKIEVASLSQARRNALAKTMLELFFKELFEWGLVQTDPNFGNFLITISTDDDPHPDILTLLDFGSAIEIPPEEQQSLNDVIAGGLEQDRERICRGLVNLGWIDENAREEVLQSFSSFCLHLLEPMQKPELLPSEYLNEKDQYCWANSQLMQRVGRKGTAQTFSRHFSTPAGSFSLIARKLTGLFTFITKLEAEFNGYDIAKKYVEQ